MTWSRESNCIICIEGEKNCSHYYKQLCQICVPIFHQHITNKKAISQNKKNNKLKFSFPINFINKQKIKGLFYYLVPFLGVFQVFDD